MLDRPRPDRLAQDAPSAERLRFLADLATRLDPLLTWLAGQPASGGDLNGLTEPAVKLRVPISTRSGTRRFAC